MLLVEADHRRHAVVEQRIAELKSAGLAHLPSGKFMANAAWLALAVMAHNLGRGVGDDWPGTTSRRPPPPPCEQRSFTIPGDSSTADDADIYDYPPAGPGRRPSTRRCGH